MGRTLTVTLPTLHADQVRAFRTKADARGGPWAVNTGKRRLAIRCGRRWGKTKLAVTRVADGAVKAQAMGYFAPDYKKLSEAYEDAKLVLKPVIDRASKIEGVIRTINGGRIDFWTLNDPNAGRSRFYHGVVIDEGAFTNIGPLEEPTSMLATWERSIEPTLFDYGGWAMVASNTNGNDPNNFLYALCNDPKWGFVEYHAPTISNPLIPIRRPGESDADHMERRLAAIEAIRANKHPLVFRQEYLAEFVDWSGVAFLDPSKWLVDGAPVEPPTHCDSVFYVVDSATKTGKANDGTAVVWYARSAFSGHPLVILDWELLQIEGDLLITQLPEWQARAEEYARVCGARGGSLGGFIEDKDSGQILLQAGMRRQMLVQPIDSGLTAVGKDERALNASDAHFTGKIKITAHAYNKVTTFKGTTRNHLVAQVTGFRVGDPDAAKRADDLLDGYTYGVALGVGNSEGY